MDVIRSGNYGTMLLGVPPGSDATTFLFPAQPQGEAVTFTPDSRFMFIASEGLSDLIRIPVSTL